jgi:hypothetical protein
MPDLTNPRDTLELVQALLAPRVEVPDIEARLLEALEGHRWVALEVIESDGTRRTRLLRRENAAELAAWVQDFAAWRVVTPDDTRLPGFERITTPPARGH